jgi:TATA-box binding protein (TBP) (component of TFIID and TFIIIB)
MNEPVKAVLVFHSGKVVFTGAKNEDDIKEAYKTLQKKLERFRMHN